MQEENQIYELNGEKEKLEFALWEEIYHRNSVPNRKKQTQDKALLNFILFFSCVVLFVISFVMMFKLRMNMKDPDVSRKMSLSFLFCPMVILASGIVMRMLGKDLKEYLALLFGIGSSRKARNNYANELNNCEAKIAHLKMQIANIDEKIYEISTNTNTNTIDKTLLLKENEALDEKFYRYAKGHWGDSADIIDINIESGKYDREYDDIKKEIEKNRNYINNMYHKKKIINIEYEKAFNDTITFILIFSLSGICTVFCSGMHTAQLTMLFISIVIFIFGCIVFPTKIAPQIMLYNIEYHYDNFRTYAENKGVIPTYIQMEKYRNRIIDLNNRKEYLERIFEYKKRHNEKFEEKSL